MIDHRQFYKLINQYKDEGLYRVFNDIVRERGEFPKAIWYSKYAIKNIVNWCSNDYLGMGQNKIVIDAMHTALDQTGAGSGGTRNIGGTSHYHVALEAELATLHSKDRALLFSSAYVANEWSLIALSRIVSNIVFLSDSKNHASLIQGLMPVRKQRPRTHELSGVAYRQKLCPRVNPYKCLHFQYKHACSYSAFHCCGSSTLWFSCVCRDTGPKALIGKTMYHERHGHLLYRALLFSRGRNRLLGNAPWRRQKPGRLSAGWP